MIKHKLLTLFVALIAATALWAQNNVITYTATRKLMETSGMVGGLHTDAFNVSITSHTFNNGRGTITFAGEVTTIGENAFFYCIELTSVSIPNSVTTIGDDAFAYCTGLTSVTIPNSVTTIGEGAFYKCSGLTSVTIPGSVTTIGKSVFSGCSGLTSVTIPNSVTTIGDYAFSDCSGLTSVTIPGSVTTIGKSVFSGCSGLTSVTIPNSVTTIGDYAFYNCSKLTSVTIPNSVTTIGYGAFSDCSGLTKTNYTGTIADWCKIQFGNSSANPIYYSHNFFINDVEIKDLVIPEGVDKIGNYAFYNCSGLTSVTIPSSVTTIGSSAFYNVNNIVYSGTATGSPWGAKCLNGYVDGYLVYSDATKTTLCGCSSAVTGEIVIPNSVTTIGDRAFYSCDGLTSVTIPNSVKTIGNNAFYGCKNVYYEDYFNQNSSSFPSNIKCKNPISCSLDKKIFNVSASLSIPEIYYEWYDEIGLADSKTSTANHYAADTNGKIVFANMPLNYSGMYYFYARQGEEYVYQGTITISTKTPSLSCSLSSTQTTITLSNIYASSDTSVHSLSKGIYYNYKRYEADKNDKVVITGIVPNTKCTLQVYGCYNGQYYYGDSKYVTTQTIAPILSVTESPTCVYAKGSYTHGDATILGTFVACTTTGSSVAGDEGLMTGLKPNKSYSFTYSVDTKEGGTYTATKTITTPALTLTTLTPKVVSAGNVVVAASTNISDLETNVGFEWRKYNAPPELPSSRAQAILYSGQMEGILHNLSLEYWKVRAYYEAADGTCYYGEWATFDPSQPAYFEPTVHTYALVTDPTVNKVQMRGYVMTGTDDVTEQGFEYWFKGSKAPRRVASATPDSIYRVQASGQVMTAVLEDLAYSTTYTCRAYAVAGGKTYYGEEVQFLTPEDPRPIYTLSVIAGENGSVNTDVSGQYREGEIVTLTATPMAGYRFLQWSDENTDNPRQLTIMANTELMAIFEVADGLLDVFINNDAQHATKFMYNNHLYILRDGNLFTATGARVK